MRLWGAVAIALLLSGCGTRLVPPSAEEIAARPPKPPRQKPVRQEPQQHPLQQPAPSYNPPPARPIPATPVQAQPATPVTGAQTAAALGVVAGPDLHTLPLSRDGAQRALTAFQLTCPALMRRTDTSGLTQGADWQQACQAAGIWQGGDPRDFFAQYFETAQVGDGATFATGYFEPEIAGSRERQPGYDVAIYGRPADLIDVDLGQFSDTLKGKKIRGRVDGQNFVPYYDRGAIEDGALAQRVPVIAWAADGIDMFFLQVQGSGRLRLPDGQVMRIGYADQNGRDYTGIGALMKQRGLLPPGQASMQSVVQYLRDHPDEGRAIMRENKSFVFFRELDGPALGALGLPVTGGVSVAADPRFVPLGAPVFLSMDRSDATGLWVAQDTGGAIKGPNRFDTFWGAGDNARATAGGMSAHGTTVLLLPIGTLAKLQGAQSAGTPPQP